MLWQSPVYAQAARKKTGSAGFFTLLEVIRQT